MSTNNIGDNPYAPGVVHDAYLPDQLIAGAQPIVTQPIILNSGTLKRGTVLGRQSVEHAELFAVAGNTGNPTFSGISTNGARVGDFAIVMTDATHFTVTDPEGVALAAGVFGTAYSQNGLNFTITAGGAACVAGDKFTGRVYAATGQYIKSVATATDGSQNPSAILADDVDASAGPVATGAYLTGEFNSRAIIIDASWTISTVRGALRAFGIFIKSSVSAADPS